MAKIFETVEMYEKVAQPGDVIVLSGYGIVNGIDNVSSKSDTFKVAKIKDDGRISLRAYRGRTNFLISANYYDQKLLLLTPKEFKNLPI